MEKATIQHLQQLGFVKEFYDKELEPEAFFMRKNFTHQYIKGLHVLVTPENTIEIWATDCALHEPSCEEVRLHKSSYSENSLSRILSWIEK